MLLASSGKSRRSQIPPDFAADSSAGRRQKSARWRQVERSPISAVPVSWSESRWRAPPHPSRQERRAKADGMLKHPYLLFVGNAADQLAAKTALGILQWRRDWCLGQIAPAGLPGDARSAGHDARRGGGAGRRNADRRRRQRRRRHPRGLDGDAGPGARAPASTSRAACTTGSPTFPRVRERPAGCGRALLDVRHPTRELRRRHRRAAVRASACSPSAPTARSARCTPRWRSSEAMRARGLDADFRATGQTGIFIAGDGVSVDAVVADFISGATEWLSPAQRSRALGPDRRPGLAVPSVLRRRQPRPAARRPAGRAGDVPRADAHATCAACRTGRCPTSPRCIAANEQAARLTNPARRLRRRLRQHQRDSAATRPTPSGELRERAAAAVRRSADARRRARSSIGWSDAHAAGPHAKRGRWPGRSPSRAAPRPPPRWWWPRSRTTAVHGRGECVPYPRYGETVDGVADAIEALAADVAAGLDRTALQQRLPAGAARNALDCALWDLGGEEQRAARSGSSRRLPAPRPVLTAETIALDTPEAMAARAVLPARPAAAEDQARRRGRGRAGRRGARGGAAGAPDRRRQRGLGPRRCWSGSAACWRRSASR